ncbi:MAG: FAD-binding protein [Promethearchaeota archaeon]
MRIKIDEDKCTGCKKCVSSCSVDGIRIVKEKATITQNCLLCGECIEACDLKAIFIVHDDESPEILVEKNIKNVWVIAEKDQGRIHRAVPEILTIGRKIADRLSEKLVIVNIGGNDEYVKNALGYKGVDEILHVYNPNFTITPPEIDIEIISQLIQDHEPAVVLAVATPKSNAILARVAKRLDIGITADCIDLKIELLTKNLLQIKPSYGNNVMAVIQATKPNKPQIATVREGLFAPMNKKQLNVKFTRIENRLDKTHELKQILLYPNHDKQEGSTIEGAEIIVAGGRGVGSKKDFQLIKELAELLGGKVAGSRTICDLGWLDKNCQVGQTGKIVRPQLYIAIGISGAIQHEVGMKNSRYIIAINKDPNAPIFNIANLGILGDLHEIIPMLIKKLKKVKKKQVES